MLSCPWMELTFTSRDVQRLTLQGQSRLSKWKAAGVLVPSNPVERGRGKETTWEANDVGAAILCGLLAEGGYPIEQAKPLIHRMQSLYAWKGDPEKSKPGNPYIKFPDFPESLAFDGFTVTELWDGDERPAGVASLVIDVRVIVAAALIASNLRYTPEGERFDSLLHYGLKDGPYGRAVVGMIHAAQRPKGMERLLAFLDIDPASEEGRRVRDVVSEMGRQVEGRRLARSTEEVNVNG